MQLNLLKHQYEFCADMENRFLALVAGYGAGKTEAFCVKTILMAAANVGYTGVICEPTYGMVKKILVPKMIEHLEKCGVPYDYWAGELKFVLHFEEGDTTIFCMSGENYQRLAGLNLAFFGCDEIDTIGKDTAEAMWHMAMSRLRSGNVYQGYSCSTPEGFRFLYQFFKADLEDDPEIKDRRMIKGRTHDNPFLPPEFISSLEANYPPQLIEAYLHGEFVNMNSGAVYVNFDRELNHTDKTIADFPKHVPLHIGQDFNVGACASIIHIIDKGLPYAVDEIAKGLNTEQVIQIIKQRYPGRQIIMYPDASGGANKTSASMSDLAMLKQAGFQLNYTAKNPYVKDRVNSMNAMFLNSKGDRRYLINTRTCKEYAKCLEQQAYAANGTPDKSAGNDHMVDAGGYFIHRCYAIQGQATVRVY